MIILAILFMVVGIYMLFRRDKTNKFYKDLQQGKIPGYAKTVGKVVCDAYKYKQVRSKRTASGYRDVKVITPIVEYFVNGEKYEGQNAKLFEDGELPVGTAVGVWYKIENPQTCILESQIKMDKSGKISDVFMGIIAIAFGVIILLVSL